MTTADLRRINIDVLVIGGGEDYPVRDDEQWLAWVLLTMGPDEWKPDPSVPYEERYPNRFPGELEYLGLA